MIALNFLFIFAESGFYILLRDCFTYQLTSRYPQEAHELGHAIGLGHRGIPPWPPGIAFASLMNPVWNNLLLAFSRYEADFAYTQGRTTSD